ncbi:hypothetical protein [Haliea sp.]|uniref:hypothetical protein n=1 Tax=Haliea sp. TaxID=1932666 RepID=UPI0025BF3262|nr:hypothetical protein [Haliea sp.]|tara:strand:- start:107 stop:322 length:216 start_codon:yes stop_codon:yes gene_type:complete
MSDQLQAELNATALDLVREQRLHNQTKANLQVISKLVADIAKDDSGYNANVVTLQDVVDYLEHVKQNNKAK